MRSKRDENDGFGEGKETNWAGGWMYWVERDDDRGLYYGHIYLPIHGQTGTNNPLGPWDDAEQKKLNEKQMCDCNTLSLGLPPDFRECAPSLTQSVSRRRGRVAACFNHLATTWRAVTWRGHIDSIDLPHVPPLDLIRHLACSLDSSRTHAIQLVPCLLMQVNTICGPLSSRLFHAPIQSVSSVTRHRSPQRSRFYRWRQTVRMNVARILCLSTSKMQGSNSDSSFPRNTRDIHKWAMLYGCDTTWVFHVLNYSLISW